MGSCRVTVNRSWSSDVAGGSGCGSRLKLWRSSDVYSRDHRLTLLFGLEEQSIIENEIRWKSLRT